MFFELGLSGKRQWFSKDVWSMELYFHILNILPCFVINRVSINICVTLDSNILRLTVLSSIGQN